MKKFEACAVISFTLLTSTILTGCGLNRCSETPLTQLQIREVQSREFDTKDTKLVMKAMMNVLQDDGYIIKNAVADLGLLSAEKNIDIENKTSAFFMTLLVQNARWNKHQILEASANVSEFGNKTRVRINFQIKTIDNFGCPQDVLSLEDSQYYQDFFEKVYKGIFIQEQAI